MDPNMLIGMVDPANNFTMGGLPMHLAQVLLMEGKPLPKELFLDVLVEKTQILINHIKNHRLGLHLTANIGGNTAIICVYENFATVNTQIFQMTISNLPGLEDQLFQLYGEINGIIHDFMLDISDMPELKDITDDES